MSAINHCRERIRFRRSQVARVLPTLPERLRRAHGRRRRGAAALAASARGVRRDGRRRDASGARQSAAAAASRTASRSPRTAIATRAGRGGSICFRCCSIPTSGARSSAASSQRTLLLNRLLVDLYGAQRVLKERLLPPGLVFGNTQFLRPCTSVAVRDDLHLHFVAFDLARSADGRWWVVSDRTQAPSGAGYALENRVVSSQCLPELFAERNVRRLASFFRAFSERFLSLSAPRPAASRVPVAGPVEAELLRARVSRALLGLQRRRRLRPHGARRPRLFEDRRGAQARRPHHAPHRLRALRSARAAHGLADRRAGPAAGGARRQGHDRQRARLRPRRERLVLELPAELCASYFLDEELAMPSFATWWCGQERERRYVLEHLDELVVRRVQLLAQPVPARPGRARSRPRCRPRTASA